MGLYEQCREETQFQIELLGTHWKLKKEEGEVQHPTTFKPCCIVMPRGELNWEVETRSSGWGTTLFIVSLCLSTNSKVLFLISLQPLPASFIYLLFPLYIPITIFITLHMSFLNLLSLNYYYTNISISNFTTKEFKYLFPIKDYRARGPRIFNLLAALTFIISRT